MVSNMDVELLVIAHCPNADAARSLVEAALAQVGLPDVPVRMTIIDSEQEALRRGFAGSPTILLDGVDPFSGSGTGTGLTCRVYKTSTGLKGVPEPSELSEALKRNAHQRPSRPEQSR